MSSVLDTNIDEFKDVLKIDRRNGILLELTCIISTGVLENIFKFCTQERGIGMQNQRKTSPGELIGYIIIGVLIAAIFSTILEVSYGQQINGLFFGLAPSCTIGVDSATITVKGWNASTDCQQMLAGGPNNFTGWDWKRFGAYSASEADGNIQCEFDLANRHVTIRDSGISTEGHDLCILVRGPGQ